jgi:hypothetical protein
MKATANVLKTDTNEVSITFTMTLGEWKGVREQVRHMTYGTPIYRIGSTIGKLLDRVEQTFAVMPDEDLLK